MDKIEVNTHYLATKASNNGEVKVGGTILVKLKTRIDHFDGLIKDVYTVFLEPNKDDNFFGLPAMHKCEYFNTREELDSFFEGVEVEYDMKLVTKIIKKSQTEIDKIKQLHGIK